MQLARRTLALVAAAAAVFLAAGAHFDASAQQIYKIVGPDGRITFSDKPPADPSVKATTASVVPLNGGANLAGLPFELRQAAARYPVTLYSSPGCQTCATGRTLLMSRGIPFAERTIASKEDSEALTRLSGTSNVPVLTIGAQHLRGFSDAEWTSFLDAAGYPKTSQLPPSYVPAAATPLVAVDNTPAAAQQRPAGTRADAAPQQPSEPAPENPAGIRF
ncbi:glutaredoxin family protein [Ramlibacter sp. PS4R-6]|uniref:glutaredoxin family protein n=1 Tax=Ramlibacter sp. PS4R-6 TaxID=3133438 RepID=UPI0030A0A957